jgi:TonB family protein
VLRHYILKNKSKIAIIFSILLHSILLLSIKTDESLGKTKKPIEFTEIKIISGPGESIKKNILSKITKKQTQKEKTQKNQSKKISNEVKVNSEVPINSNTKKNITKNKNKKYLDKKEALQSSKPQDSSRRGNKSKNIKNEIQKGSLKGKGRKKIICKNCLEPIYSQQSIRRGLEGITTVKVTIDTTGIVINAIITNSSGHKDIDNASIKAAKNSTFRPISKVSTINIKYEHKIKNFL